VLAFPVAYYMARVASPRTRNILVVAVLTPLWASYLVKAYVWRTMLGEEGIINWLLAPFGLELQGKSSLGLWLSFTYLWLPFMILPIYAGLERIPNSLIEASADLGARAGRTFRRVIMPIVLPAAVAGSIFTFSLTIGDFITPQIVYQGKQEPMEFTPMTGAQGLRPVKPTKDNGERNKAGYAFWNTIPYGATVEVKTLIS